MPIVTRCPSCDRPLRLPENLIGTTVRCPGCQTTFTAVAPDDAPLPDGPEQPSRGVTERPARTSPRPASGPTDEVEFEDPYSGDPDFEGRSGNRRPRSRDQARQMVMGPAIALMVIGGLGLGMAALNTLVMVVGLNAPARPNAAAFGVPPPGQDAAYRVGQVVGATIGFPWALVVLIGGFQMITLRSRRGAMTASIVAMVPCSLCCLLGLPFGIWSLVVLGKPEVASAF